MVAVLRICRRSQPETSEPETAEGAGSEAQHSAPPRHRIRCSDQRCAASDEENRQGADELPPGVAGSRQPNGPR